MSLRLRLFLGLAGIVAVMVAAQWWWVRGLTRDLSDEVGVVAFEVSHSIFSFFNHDKQPCPEGATCREERRDDGVLVHHVERPPLAFAFDEDVNGAVSASGDVTIQGNASFHEGDEHRQYEILLAPSAGDPPPEVHWISGVADIADIADDADKAHSAHVTRSADAAAPSGEERPRKRSVSVARRLPTITGEEPQRIMVRLETAVTSDDPESANTGQNAWFFSTRKPVQPGYLAMLTADDKNVVRRIPIPDEGLNEKLERFRQRTLLGSLAILAAGLLLSAVVAHRVSAPLTRLAQAARQVGDGALGAQVPVTATGEVGRAIGAFNRMSSELADLDRKTRQLRAREHLGEIGEIARGLAHTLRNPLNALGLSVEELASRAPAASSGLAASARRQIRRIDQSIRSFLALASQGGGVVSEVAPGELAQDVALEALQDCVGKDSGGKVRLDVDVDGATPAVRAVEPELRAVLQALLVNAVEASPEGGTVAIRVAPSGAGRVRVEIDDEGPGLADEVRGRLFTPHLTTKANGSGMGLFLAHRIATNRYGGNLELEDRPGGGTRAVLELGPRNQEQNDGA